MFLWEKKIKQKRSVRLLGWAGKKVFHDNKSAWGKGERERKTYGCVSKLQGNTKKEKTTTTNHGRLCKKKKYLFMNIIDAPQKYPFLPYHPIRVYRVVSTYAALQMNKLTRLVPLFGHFARFQLTNSKKTDMIK
jgi:hypothetical protein